jgi:hypothetical protein
MLSKSNKGALAEYRVAVLLLAANWNVFRCMTPNSSVDLVLIRRGHTLKCQVKSASGAGAGTAGNRKNLRQGNNDVLAVVTPDNIIFKVRSRRIQRLFPGSILARPVKRHKDSHRKSHRKATRRIS